MNRMGEPHPMFLHADCSFQDAKKKSEQTGVDKTQRNRFVVRSFAGTQHCPSVSIVFRMNHATCAQPNPLGLFDSLRLVACGTSRVGRPPAPDIVELVMED
jgi:hypothetical protein